MFQIKDSRNIAAMRILYYNDDRLEMVRTKDGKNFNVSVFFHPDDTEIPYGKLSPTEAVKEMNNKIKQHTKGYHHTLAVEILYKDRSSREFWLDENGKVAIDF